MRPNNKRSTVFRLPVWLALTSAMVMIVLGGVLYGQYSQRWGPPADLVAAGIQLTEMPRQIGPWKMADELPINSSALEMLECAGYVSRRYVHENDGRSLTVAILVGPPGPIAVHTPEICFSSRAYEIQGRRSAVAMRLGKAQDSVHSFWAVEFQTRSPMADVLRVYYAWSRGDLWNASQRPRYEYAAAPFLYKLQLAFPLAAGSEQVGPDPGRQFLEDLNQSGWKFGTTASANDGRTSLTKRDDD